MLRRVRAVLAGVLATAGICLLAVGPAAAVTDPFTVGYVWADNPTVAVNTCYTPASFYSYNSKVLTNTVCRVGTGSYVVHFPGLASPGGNAQVTSYGATPNSCKVDFWVPSGTEEQVGVSCYTFAGAATTAYFTASFARGGGAGNTIAWAWADNPTAASYTPSLTYQYNNQGGAATVNRTGVGAYTVSFPDSSGALPKGSVKVTSYGSGSAVCKVVAWGPNAGATTEQVFVQCYTSAGAPSDQRFSVVYVEGMNILGNNLMGTMGYVWGDQPSSGSYTPNLNYQLSRSITQFGTVTITSPAVGTYDVFLPFTDHSLDGGHVSVTAYGAGTARCQVGFWTGAPGGKTARAYCFTNTGALTDTYFTLQYVAKAQ